MQSLLKLGNCGHGIAKAIRK